MSSNQVGQLQINLGHNVQSAVLIQWQCTSSSGYAARTKVNAQSAPMTLYVFDQDFEYTSGRALTEKHAHRWVPMCYQKGVKNAWQLWLTHLEQWLEKNKNKEECELWVNVAGNSIGRFGASYHMQPKINGFVYLLLEKAQTYLKAHQVQLCVRSGGQSGADWAGLVAGSALGLKCVGLFPAGFRQREDDGSDTINDPVGLEKKVLEQREQLLDTVLQYRLEKQKQSQESSRSIKVLKRGI